MRLADWTWLGWLARGLRWLGIVLYVPTDLHLPYLPGVAIGRVNRALHPHAEFGIGRDAEPTINEGISYEHITKIYRSW